MNKFITPFLSKRSFLKGSTQFVFTAALAFVSFFSTAQPIKALSDGKLYTFDAQAPTLLIGNAVTITGITAGQVLVGMDYRPNTGELIGLGYNSGTNAARLYSINTTSGAATAIGAADITLTLGTGPVAFDFNPTVDRIRVMGSNNKNYRLNPNNGAIAATDFDLNYKAADANFGKNPYIGSCAYTNSYIGATATTLYDFDDSLNVFATQVPPNDGVLNSLAGPTGITINTTDRSSDMDIFYDKATSTNKAYFSANPDGTTNDNLYTVNLTTGVSTLVGLIGTGLAVQDIAVAIDRTLPNPTGKTVFALTQTNAGANNNIISFNTSNPSVIRSLVTVTGLKAGQGIVGMDIRPSDTKLYALGKKTGVDSISLYTINTTTGVATLVKDSIVKMELGNGPIALDFNPVVDRIRIVSSNKNNYRLHPATLAVTTDTALTYKAGDVNAGKTPFVGSVAYTNSFAGTTTTKLYDIDDSLSVLAQQNTPNGGFLNTIGSLGKTLGKMDATSDLDIVYDKTSSANTAYLAANTGTDVNDDLYTVDLATGKATLVGRIGFGSAIRDIAGEVPAITAGIETSAPVSFQLAVYPNPTHSNTMISFSLENNSRASIMIYDYSGKLISKIADQAFNAGKNQFELATADLAKGIYFVTLTVNNTSQNVSKLVVD